MMRAKLRIWSFSALGRSAAESKRPRALVLALTTANSTSAASTPSGRPPSALRRASLKASLSGAPAICSSFFLDSLPAASAATKHVGTTSHEVEAEEVSPFVSISCMDATKRRKPSGEASHPGHEICDAHASKVR
ncbi:hypothetical protein K402DRAFT_200278 [Aulographum hederae CBS 113979]|uniref:Uncharacterized protein n=1 Tax=Aulographum hederae CBS 113979 TaxID=1176131 RepID=A0A6G1HC49_9PEZI|nr:hypothetical protein K402DRAFT_200278 [Aulographum hederae CBS 113979]